jgi:hypothetical protein
MTRIINIANELIVYKSYTVGSSKVVETNVLSDSETAALYQMTQRATKCTSN